MLKLLSFDREGTWWQLFQKPIMCTQFDIYVFITITGYNPASSQCFGTDMVSQFSGCWLILSVYIIMSFDFPFVRLFGVR